MPTKIKPQVQPNRYVSQQELSVSCFGSTKGNIIQSNDYNLCLKSLNESSYYIKANAVPKHLCTVELINKRSQIDKLGILSSKVCMIMNNIKKDDDVDNEIDVLIGGNAGDFRFVLN